MVAGAILMHTADQYSCHGGHVGGKSIQVTIFMMDGTAIMGVLAEY